MNEQQYYNPNMYQQSPYYGMFNNGVMTGGGMVPNMMYNTAPQSSTLTPEEFDFLNKNKAGFSLNATQEEITAALCNHVNQNHTSALIMDDDGVSCHCTVCGYKFNPVPELTKEEVQSAVNMVINVFQTLKIMWRSIDPSALREFVKVIPYLAKLPDAFEIAKNDFKKYENQNMFASNTPASAFSIFGSIVGPNNYAGYANGYSGYAMPPQQQMYGYNPQPNAYAPQQPMTPQYGAPVQAPYPVPQPVAPYGVGGNPLYQQPNAYAPQQPMNPPQGFAMNPQGAAAPAPQAQVTNATAPQANAPAQKADANQAPFKA